MRLIDADALIENLKSNFDSSDVYTDKDQFIIDCIHLLDNTPTAVKIDIDDIEYKAYCKGLEDGKKIARPQGEWIPVSEKMPDNETEVLIQYGKSMMVGYHKFDFIVYPSEFEDENETGWYDSKDDYICDSDEVTAWRPLPEPYMKGGADND